MPEDCLALPPTIATIWCQPTQRLVPAVLDMAAASRNSYLPGTVLGDWALTDTAIFPGLRRTSVYQMLAFQENGAMTDIEIFCSQKYKR